MLALSGVAAESMVRDVGWTMMDIGKRIERGIWLVTLLSATLTTVRSAGAEQTIMVTPRKNPANINSFDDLSRDGITWVACVYSAPCGKVARQLIKMNKIWNWPSSRG